MIKRILLAAILGGLAVFMWQSVAHMHLPLGEVGLKSLPDEPAMLAAFKSNISEPGFYLFPAPERSGSSDEQQQQAMKRAIEKMHNGPAGILIIHPGGMDMMMTRQLVMQFLFDVAEMLLAGVLLSLGTAQKNYVTRVLFVILVGLVPTLAVELPLWNWYSFPIAYTAAQFVIHLVGFLVGGLVVASFVRPKPT